ncbi:hypothetical protein [Streptomyces sp. Qhu_M48]
MTCLAVIQAELRRTRVEPGLPGSWTRCALTGERLEKRVNSFPLESAKV